MKSLPFLLFSGTLAAQVIVHDPANTAINSAVQAGQAANHVEILRQWASNLEKLNQQLEQLRAQVAEQRRIRQILGDPSGAGDRLILEKLGHTEFGRAYGETSAAIRALAWAAQSLRNTAEGIYEELDDHSVLNRPFVRRPAPYRRYAALERHAENLDTVLAQTDPRMAELQRDLADTLGQLKSAPTQAEVDKLHAKIAVLNGQLAVLEGQRRNAAAQLQAQQILNENQAAKERQDLLEKQIADEEQAFSAIGAWQESLKLTPANYTRP